MSEPTTAIPAHRHQVNARSGEPRSVEGGNDDRAAKPKAPRKAAAKKAPANKPTPTPAAAIAAPPGPMVNG